jgi:peptidoglycan/xylan/chitin deacetylase (PgdA/CDA1 family)
LEVISLRKIFLIILLLLLVSINQAFAAERGIPVLMYHSVQNIPNNAAVISTKNFGLQMKYLADNGYKTLTLDQLNAFLSDKNFSFPKKSVVLTFDDGYKDTYTTVMPILQKYNFKASLFLVTNKIKKNVFTSEEIKTMQKNGINTYSHTLSHPDLKSLSSIQQEKEIIQSESVLKSMGIKHSLYFCYPYSYFNNTTIKLIKKHGYKMAFTNYPGWVNPGDNPLTLKRVYIGNTVSLSDFKERMQKPNYALIK